MAELLKIQPIAPPVATGQVRIQPPAASHIGRGLTRLGVEMMREQEREQEQQDIYRIEGQINRLHDIDTDLLYGDKGALTLKGENAFNLGEPFTAAYRRQYDERAQELESELDNDTQKQRFRVVADKLRSQFSRRLQVHEAEQAMAVRDSAFKGVVATEAEAVARAVDNPDFNSSRDQIDFAISRATGNARNYYGSELGLSGEQVEAEVLKLESAMHKRVVDGYLEKNDPLSARAYFEANKDRIREADAKAARDQIQKDDRDYVVTQQADRIWRDLGPKSDDDPVNLDVMVREATKVFERDGDARKLLTAELQDRQQRHDYSARERRAAVEGGVWEQVLNGRPLSTIRRSPSFRALDGKSQAKAIAEIESFQRRNENDPGVQLQKFAEYWALSDPETLTAMSDAEIFSRAPVLGREYLERLLVTKRNLLKQDDKILEAKMDQDSFNYLAREAGLKVGSTNESDKATLGFLKYRVETLIDLEQKKKKRVLDREEKDAILKKLLVEIPVTVKNPWYIGGGLTTEPRRLYEVQHPENISIPRQDREMIAEALRKAGVQNPTEAQIREGFIRLRMK